MLSQGTVWWISRYNGKRAFIDFRENHALVIDLFPPGPYDSAGMHGAVWQRLEKTEGPYDLPEDGPLTLASYVAAEPVDIYLEHPAVGASLPEMPLFLRPERYINVPLEMTCQEAYRSMPAFWRGVLEQPTSKAPWTTRCDSPLVVIPAD